MKRFLIIFLFLVTIRASAQRDTLEPVRLPDHADIIQLSTHTYFFRDVSGKLTVNDIFRMSPDSMTKGNADAMNFGNTRDVIWGIVWISSATDQEVCLHFEPPLMNQYSLFHLQEGSTGFAEEKFGYDIDRKTRKLQVSGYDVNLVLRSNVPQPVIIRCESDLPVFIQLMVSDTAHASAIRERMDYANGIYLGIMIIMMLYNLFLFISNHNRVYIYYTLYILFSTIFISFANGSVYYMPEFLYGINKTNTTIFPLLFGLFGMLFSVVYLDLRKNAPRLFRINSILYVLVAVNFIVGFFNGHLGIEMIQLNGILLSLFCIACGNVVWKKGYKPARFYLVGFGFYMASLLTYIILGLISVQLKFPAYFILMLGSAVEAIILSFAIGDKLNSAIAETKSANDRALAAAMENEKLIREQNVVLEHKVKERTAEIEEQKSIIEEKNKDILDSIHYAKRIQRALLASDTLLKNNLSDYFVFYRPKDIVSGDFYWADEAPDGKFLLLTGDCTGHGVPGAFMSLLNISILHEITNGLRITSPSLVLDQQRKTIISSLNPGGQEETSKDGMDCVLCSFDRANRKLEMAGANNSIWILRAGSMLEYKGDKQPIGVHEGPELKYQLHCVDLLPGDIVYSFTDGFADQFGGVRGKKYKYKKLQEKLIAIGGLSMEQQKNALEKEFQEWKGNLEQLDDVLVIGVLIK